MKYIMFEKEINGVKIRMPIIFPNNLVHLDIAKALKNVVGSSRIVGAGDIIIRAVSCSGESTTIGIKSKEIDKEIINNYDYSHGLKDALDFNEDMLRELFRREE